MTPTVGGDQRRRGAADVGIDRRQAQLTDVDTPPWARHTDQGWMLTIRAQPGASRSEVSGPYGEALRIRLAAPANDGKANAELVRFLAEALGVGRAAVTLVRGHTGRDKVVAVADPDADVDVTTLG